MAFANLFTKLAAFEEDAKCAFQPALTDGKDTGNGRRHGDRKRKNKGKQTSSYEKKPRHQPQTTRTDGATSFRHDHHQAKHSQRKFQEYSNAGFKVSHSRIHKTDHANVPHKGQNTKTKNEWKVNEQRGQKKKWEQQKRGQEDGRRPATRSGRPQRTGQEDRKNSNEDSKVKHTRFMTQEFKDQNAICVGDDLLCKYFLRGKCIKGDECQLKHVESYNDLMKESCKFYVQGLCTKGESCPYMHKSFPCKFFHRRGKCFQGESCRFSHEPLTELTKKLLDEALQRENELIELSKKAEQELSVQPVNSEQSENTEATKTPDILQQPLRPNFYQSVEKESSAAQAEELTENSEEAVTPHTADALSALSVNVDQKEPVCYSVEAVLGPQLSKPLLSFFTAPRSQEPAPLRSSDSTADSSSNQNHVPYSVEAVLKPFKSAETPPTPTSQTVSCSQITGSKGLKLGSEPSPETQNEKSCYSERNTFLGKLFQSLPSLQAHSNLPSNSCSDQTLPSRRHTEVRVEQSDSRTLHTDVTRSADSNGEGVKHFGPHQCKTVSSNSSSRPSFPSVRSKPHLSVMTPNLRSSFKPFSPSSYSSKFRSRDAVSPQPISNPMKSSDSPDFVSYPSTKRPANSDLHPKDATADCSSKKADGHLAGGCKQKTAFHSLFAKPITDSLLRKDALTTSFCPQGLNQSSSPAPQSAGLETNSLKTAAPPDKPPARSFVSLFVAPLPNLQPQGDRSRTSSALQKPVLEVEAAPRFSDSEQRAANLQTQRDEKADVQTPLRVQGVCPVPTSSHFSPDPENRHESGSAECRDQITDGACSPVSGSPCEGSTPRAINQTTTHTDHSVPEISSRKEVAGKSILRTLFQSLSPYKQDGEQQDPDQKIQEEAEISRRRFSENQQQTRKKRRQKK